MYKGWMDVPRVPVAAGGHPGGDAMYHIAPGIDKPYAVMSVSSVWTVLLVIHVTKVISETCEIIEMSDIKYPPDHGSDGDARCRPVARRGS